MLVETPYPELDEIIELIGEAGRRVSEIEASEGAAGNISVYLGWDVDPRRKFPVEETIDLPVELTELAAKGGVFVVTGSGRRLREIKDDPPANLGVVILNPDGRTARLYSSPRRLYARLTSEFNSHLAVHCDQVIGTSTNFNAIIHAQPMHLTFLSHIPRYQDEKYLNQHLLRWQPEQIVNLPEGIGYIPFRLPGSPALMEPTVEKLRTHRIVLWAKHGVMARSDNSVKRACDRIEYAETGAHYEYLNLASGELAEGLSADDVRSIAAAFNIKQTIF